MLLLVRNVQTLRTVACIAMLVVGESVVETCTATTILQFSSGPVVRFDVSRFRFDMVPLASCLTLGCCDGGDRFVLRHYEMFGEIEREREVIF
jgi:hypothetical protein